MTARDLAKFGGAMLVGMVLAFPAGMMFAGREAPPRAPAAGAEAVAQRQVFSPKVLDDPYFLEQQRRNVEALEASCRARGENCAEAEQARSWLARRSRR